MNMFEVITIIFTALGLVCGIVAVYSHIKIQIAKIEVSIDYIRVELKEIANDVKFLKTKIKQ